LKEKEDIIKKLENEINNLKSVLVDIRSRNDQTQKIVSALPIETNINSHINANPSIITSNSSILCGNGNSKWKKNSQEFFDSMDRRLQEAMSRFHNLNDINVTTNRRTITTSSLPKNNIQSTTTIPKSQSAEPQLPKKSNNDYQSIRRQLIPNTIINVKETQKTSATTSQIAEKNDEDQAMDLLSLSSYYEENNSINYIQSTRAELNDDNNIDSVDIDDTLKGDHNQNENDIDDTNNSLLFSKSQIQNICNNNDDNDNSDNDYSIQFHYGHKHDLNSRRSYGTL